MDINGKILGEGSFAVVYESKDKKCAIKVEDNGYNNLLKKEGRMMMKMSEKDKKGRFVIPVYMYKEDKDMSYLVMEKMKMSMSDIIKKVGEIDKYSVRCIMIKLIQTLRFIHLFGICHGDIKPENVMISDDYSKIYLVDFGLFKVFKIGNRHVEKRRDMGYSGTLRYMSKNVNMGYKMSRRDDMISLGYMCIYLQKGGLPWQGLNELKRSKRYEKVGEMKKNIDNKILCDGCVKGMREYMEYVNKLEFEEKPDYDYLLNLFK